MTCRDDVGTTGPDKSESKRYLLVPNCFLGIIDTGITPEEWNIFKLRWDVLVDGSGFDPAVSSSQLFQCASKGLGTSLLKADPSITSNPTADLMKAMKTLAVVAVATGVIRPC